MAVGVFPVLAEALYLALMRCDEVCRSNTDWNLGWHADPGAWQWNMQLAIAGLGLAASVAGVRRASRGGWARFWPAGVIAVVSYTGWFVGI